MNAAADYVGDDIVVSVVGDDDVGDDDDYDDNDNDDENDDDVSL